MTYMLDTNICIYAMKNRPEKVLERFKKELNNGICVSSITLAELEYGMKNSTNPAVSFPLVRLRHLSTERSERTCKGGGHRLVRLIC